MAFSGTLIGVLRGKKHFFQMEWVDVDHGFTAVEGGYNITSIEGGKPHVVFIRTEQMKVFEEHSSIRARVMALRALADSPVEKLTDSDALCDWLREFIGPPKPHGLEVLWKSESPE